MFSYQASNTSLELSFESVSLEAASRSSKARPADGRQQEVDDFDIYNQSTVKSGVYFMCFFREDASLILYLFIT